MEGAKGKALGRENAGQTCFFAVDFGRLLRTCFWGCTPAKNVRGERIVVKRIKEEHETVGVTDSLYSNLRSKAVFFCLTCV